MMRAVRKIRRSVSIDSGGADSIATRSMTIYGEGAADTLLEIEKHRRALVLARTHTSATRGRGRGRGGCKRTATTVDTGDGLKLADHEHRVQGMAGGDISIATDVGAAVRAQGDTAVEATPSAPVKSHCDCLM